MKGLAVLRTGLVLVCLPFFAACGGGSSSPSAAMGAEVPQQSVALAPTGVGTRSVAKRSAGVKQVTCTPFPYPAPMLPQPCTIYVGGFISPIHQETPAQQIASTATFENQIGRPIAMNLHYYNWTDGFPGIGENDDYNHNRIPFISWHCGVTDASIVNGSQDTLLAKRAQLLKAYGHPVFIRYKWEMNLTYNTPCIDKAHDGNSGHYNPQYYIAAWQHIRSLFASSGVTNVTWVWNPSSSGNTPTDYYPGDAYVDWVGFDHYDTNAENFYDTMSTTAQSSPPYKPIYTYPYYSKAFPNKPLIVGETGVTQQLQPMYIGGADQALQQNFPNIQGFMYWDSTGVRGQYQLLQFGIQAYAQFAAGPYEQGSILLR